MISCSKTPNIMGFLIFNLCWDRIYFLETKNQRTNGPVNAHLRSAAYTNKHD